MRHLVNLISHFPAGSTPTYTYTSLQECHDLLQQEQNASNISTNAAMSGEKTTTTAAAAATAEMTREIFDSPNLQMFVYNKSTIISVMEMEKVR